VPTFLKTRTYVQLVSRVAFLHICSPGETGTRFARAVAIGRIWLDRREISHGECGVSAWLAHARIGIVAGRTAMPNLPVAAARAKLSLMW